MKKLLYLAILPVVFLLANESAAAQDLNSVKKANMPFQNFESTSSIALVHRSGVVRSDAGNRLGNPARLRVELNIGGKYRKNTEFFLLGGAQRAPNSERIAQFRPEFEVSQRLPIDEQFRAQPFVKGKMPFAADGSRGSMGIALKREQKLSAPLGLVKVNATWSEGGSWASRSSAAVIKNETGRSAAEYGLTDLNSGEDVGGTNMEKGQNFESELKILGNIVPNMLAIVDAEFSTKMTVVHIPKYELNGNGKVYRSYARRAKVQNSLIVGYNGLDNYRIFAEIDILYRGIYDAPVSANDRSGDPFLTTVLSVASLF
jgi:hypothetical protein